MLVGTLKSIGQYALFIQPHMHCESYLAPTECQGFSCLRFWWKDSSIKYNFMYGLYLPFILILFLSAIDNYDKRQ